MTERDYLETMLQEIFSLSQKALFYINDQNYESEKLRESFKILTFPLEKIKRAETEITDFRSDKNEEKEIEEMLKGTKGSLRTRDDGRYEFRYYCDGKQFSVYGKTKTELAKKVKDSRKNIKPTSRQKEKAVSVGLTFSTFYERWKTLFKKGKIRDNSLYQADCKIKKHIIPRLGNKSLKAICAEDLQVIFNEIGSARTEKYLYTILHQVFEKAIALGYINRSPLLGVEKTKYVAKESTYLRDEEIAVLLRDAPPRYAELFRFYLLTGCRRNEAFAVKASDVDMLNGVLHIPGTKTRSSDRYIPIGPELKTLLGSMKDREVLFKFCPEEVTRMFHKILPNHHLHELRHTFATKCLSAGVDMKVIQLWLGHSSSQTTANIYAKVSKELFARSSENLPLFLPLNLPLKTE